MAVFSGCVSHNVNDKKQAEKIVLDSAKQRGWKNIEIISTSPRENGWSVFVNHDNGHVGSHGTFEVRNGKVIDFVGGK